MKNSFKLEANPLDLLKIVPAETLITLGIASVIVFVGTLVAIPFILIRLPHDYFDVRTKRAWMRDQHPAFRVVGLVIKNIVGLAFVLAGLAMLVLPGQGLLTILIGISLLDFPGKQRLEARIVGHPTVLNAINSLRSKFGKRPLMIAPR